MKKTAVVSICVVLWVGTGTMGDIFQGFNHDVGIGGQFIWNSGVGGADLDLATEVKNLQHTTGVLSFGGQGLCSSFGTAASGGGDGISIRGMSQMTSQGLDGGAAFGVVGFPGQVQSVGTNMGPIGQTEGVVFGSIQNLQRNDGPGGGNAVSNLGLFEGQIAKNNIGKGIEWYVLGGQQTANVGGGSTGVGNVTTGMGSSAAQLQLIQ